MNEHFCEKISLYQADEDTYLTIKSFNGNWVFHRFHFACDQCVYDGEAQYEGELITICDVAINYCPYCGVLLNKNLSISSEQIFRTTEKNSHKCSILDEYNRKYPHVGFSFDTNAEWKIFMDIYGWFLKRYSSATERMIKAEEAYRDELIFWHATGIDYCPFCGIKLPELIL